MRPTNNASVDLVMVCSLPDFFFPPLLVQWASQAPPLCLPHHFYASEATAGVAYGVAWRRGRAGR